MKFVMKTAAAVLMAAVLFTGCGEQPAESAASAESAESAASSAVSAPESIGAGIEADGKGEMTPEDLLGEWLYVGQGCILTFNDDGTCVVDYDGSILVCTYECENDQVILTYTEDVEKGIGEFGDDGLLYFNGSDMGFMTQNTWESDAGCGMEVYDYMGTWLAAEDDCLFTIMEDLTFVLQDGDSTIQGEVLWNPADFVELHAEDGTVLNVYPHWTEDNLVESVEVDGYNGAFLPE